MLCACFSVDMDMNHCLLCNLGETWFTLWFCDHEMHSEDYAVNIYKRCFLFDLNTSLLLRSLIFSIPFLSWSAQGYIYAVNLPVNLNFLCLFWVVDFDRLCSLIFLMVGRLVNQRSGASLLCVRNCLFTSMELNKCEYFSVGCLFYICPQMIWQKFTGKKWFHMCFSFTCEASFI